MLQQVFRACFWVTALRPVLSAPSISYTNRNASQQFPRGSFLPRADANFDVWDHSDITKMAAIGDSYSAGIGAGSRLGTVEDTDSYLCSRYDNSYPWLVHQSDALGDPLARKFQFVSCSGALATEVRSNQIPKIDAGQQVILISAGGNDIGLTDILNQCVYQWFSITLEQLILTKIAQYVEGWKWVKFFDFDAAARGCDPQLDVSEIKATDDAFAKMLDSLITSAKLKLASGGMIYYTGYGKFFSESYTSDCDSVTWTVWLHRLSAFRGNQYLTVDRRKRMNRLVDQVNSQIRAAVERAGASVIFIDYDHYIGEFDGRYCEPGVNEATAESGNRPGLMFYELNTKDPIGLSPMRRSQGSPAGGTFEGDLGEFGMMYLYIDSEAKFADPNVDGTPSSAADLVSAAAASSNAGSILNPLPDGYGRSFHPQILLHRLIANDIIYEMTNHKSLSNKQAAIPEDFYFDNVCTVPSTDPSKCFGTKGTTNPPSNYVQRILPLGASITWGQGSTTGNGYRKFLADKIVAAGGTVNYVGSRQSGSMDDSDVEGTQGAVIIEVERNLEYSLPYKPNLILINAGTNDCTLGIDVEDAHLRMGKIVDRIFGAIPGVVVVLSTLIPNTMKPGNIAIYNANLRTMVASRKAGGQRIQLADMQGPDGDGPLVSDLQDGNTHPNDAGFQKMANVWYKSLEEVYKNCWLSPPLESGISDTGTGGRPDTMCEKSLENVQLATLTQRGSVSTKADAPYTHVGVPKGALNLNLNLDMPVIIRDAGGVRWADINGDGIDDFVYIGNESTLSVALTNKLVDDVVTVGNVINSPLPGPCLRKGIRFADANGDGRDDYFCFTPYGELQCWLNFPGSDQDERPNWVSLGSVMTLPSGSLEKDIRLADIDGDGRVDFVAVSQVGLDVIATAWRNRGQGDEIKSFDAIGEIMRVNIAAIGLEENVDVRSYRFVDLNGDGRDDFIVVFGKGSVWTWINHRAYTLGLAPKWDAVGLTSTGRGINIEDITGLHHARVRGTRRHDYIHVRDKWSQGLIPLIDIYANEGSGGLYLKGDGCRYCDMRGRGADDYIWMRSDGALHVFGNRNEPPFWDDLGDIPFPYPEWVMNRRDIHLADIDGDGKCDYIWVNPKVPEFTVFINVWTASGGFKWGPPRIYSAAPATGLAGSIGIHCSNRYTYNPLDFPVRFSDIDGDGRADYLCLDADGRTTAAVADGQGIPIITSARFLPAGYKSVGQIKLSEGVDRTSIRFADINGDGRADYLIVGKLDGAVRAWTNQGNIPTSGSSYKWGGNGGKVGYGQISRGENSHFANIKGMGRADLVVVHPDTAVASTYFNICPGGGKGLMPKLAFLPGCTVC